MLKNVALTGWALLLVLWGDRASAELTPKGAVPRGNPGEWITPQDYPRAAKKDLAEGVTEFRVQVGRNGNVTGCSILASSGSKALDDATCRLLRARGEFFPATDERGQPTRGTYTNRVRWTMSSGYTSWPSDVKLVDPNRSVR